jgi:hypothetical protein
VLLRQHIVNLIPVSNCRRAAKLIRDLRVDDMESPAEQGNIRGRFVAKEFAMPDPWFPLCRFFGNNDQYRAVVDFEVLSHIPVPVALLPRERLFGGEVKRRL